MTLAEFVAAYTSKYLDYDGVYGAQCVDLIDYYCRDVLGIPIVWANAVDWYGRDATYEQWIPNRWNDLTNYPQPGDIVVWGQNVVVGTGVNGHIAVCLSADGVSFISFDQNWPPGSSCHAQHHSFDGVIGWGRRIKPPSPTPVSSVGPADDTGKEGPFDWLLQLFRWLARIFAERK